MTARTHYDVLGLPRRFALDEGELQRRYLELSRQYHPDRFAKGTPAERRAALVRTTDLNDAYRTLKDERKRAEYLLELEGIDLGEDRAAKTGMRKLAPKQSLLMEVMELREALADSRQAGDRDGVRRLADDVLDRQKLAMAVVREVFRGIDETGGRERLDEAAEAMVSLRYYSRFFEEVEAFDESHASTDLV